MRTRVAYVLGDLAIGGAQRQLLTLLAATAGRVEAAVYTWRAGPHPFAASLPPEVPHLRVPKRWKLDPTFPGRLRSALVDFEPDVVHAWLAPANAWVIAASVAAPWRVVTHELVTRGGPWWRFPHWFADACLADSEAALGRLPRGEVLPPAIAAPPMGPMATLPGRVALILGGVHPDKGTLEAIDASAEAGCVAVVVGPTLHEGYGASVDARVRALGERARRLPATVDPWPYLRRADVVVLASHTESAPNVVLEALALGRAVVATDVGDVRRLLDDGRLGTLVAPGSVRALAAAIRDAKPVPDGPAWVLAHYAPARMADAALALYARLSP